MASTLGEADAPLAESNKSDIVAPEVLTQDTKKSEPSEAEKETEASYEFVGLPAGWRSDPLRPLGTSYEVGEFLSATEEGSARPFDVVMIHGLGGHLETSFNHPNWAHTLHEKYPHSRALGCTYISDDFRQLPFEFRTLELHAREMLNDLLELQEEMGFSPDTSRPIVFVGHDVGGTIVKLALWIASLEYGKYRRILDNVRMIIFFGTPHRCTSEIVLEDMIANLVISALPPNPLFWQAADNVKSLTKAIVQINGYFDTTNLASLLEIVNVVSDAEPKEAFFDVPTTTFGTAFEDIVKVTLSHGKLALSPALEKFYPAIDRTLTAKYDDLALDSMRCFRLIAAPSTTVLPLISATDRFRPVTDHATFTEWFEGYGTDLLYVYNSPRLSEVSDHILHTLVEASRKRTTKDLILTFSFSEHDDRRNSITSMLTTILAQAFSHVQNFTDFLVYEQLIFYKSWTQPELQLLTNTVLGHNDHEGIVLIINGINQCDESSVLYLQDLCHYLSLSEHRIKILITGTDDLTTKRLLKDYKSIDLQNLPIHDVDLAISRAEVNRHFASLTHERTLFARYFSEVVAYLTPFNENIESLRLAKEYLRCNPERIQAPKNSSPGSVHEIFELVMASVAPEKQSWARDVLMLVLYSYRPLKTWELATALAVKERTLPKLGPEFDEIIGFNGITSEIEAVFQGLLRVKSHEVLIAHPKFKAFIAGAKEESWYYSVAIASNAHIMILETALRYFTIPEVQYRIFQRYQHRVEKGQSAVFPESFDDHFLGGESYYHRYSFASYAASYWSKHYNELSEETRTSIPKGFLQDDEACRAWAQVLWWVGNPVKRPVRSFVSPVPVLAGLGLRDLIHMDQPPDRLGRALALNEASRNAHMEIVRDLLKFGYYTSTEVNIALNTSGSCGNEQLIIELLQYCVDNFKVEFNPPVTSTVTKATPDEIEAGTIADTSTGEKLAPKLLLGPDLLCRAVAFSYERLVTQLLKLGAPPSGPSVKGLTPVDFAVRQRNPNILKLLIDAKAELGINTTLAYHPLHLAVIYAMPEMVQQLVDAGVNLNLKNSSDSTAAYLAAWHRHPQALKPVVKAGADLSNDTTGLWTPLTCCARRDTRRCAKILLDNGANSNVKGFNEWTPLRSATIQGYLELSKLLLDHKADPNSKSGADGAPIICEVARQGNLPLVKLLVDRGADFLAFDSNQSSPLLNAAVCGKTDVCEYLIGLGADLNAEDVTGFNPIALAAYSSFPETVKLLHEKGVNLHAPTKTTWMPIHYAYDDAATMRAILECGGQIDAVGDFYTPLLLAATFNKPETLDVLLEYKPNLEKTYDNPELNPGLTALSIATTYGFMPLVATLLEAGSNVNHQSTNGSFALEYPVRDNNVPLLKLLLEYNPDQTLVDQNGHTALHCIVGGTDLGIAKALVNAGAPLEIVNMRGYTPLGEAVAESNLEITKYLIRKGANMNVVGGNLGGPLHLAARNDTLEFVTTLVDAGADVNSLDPYMGTPIQAACSRYQEGDPDDFRALKNKVIKYFLDECKDIDLDITGGDYACALNAICAYASSDLVKSVLERGVQVTVPDKMSRHAIHFAASNSLQSFLHVHAAGADIEARDKIGRTVLHWAAIGGNVEVIERVLSLSRSQLDERDADGWTPLHWACRGAGTAMNERSIAIKKAVISIFLKRGADPTLVAKGGGGDREWSCLSIARYNGGAGEADSYEEYMTWLVGVLKEKANGKLDESAEVHQSKKAKERGEYCDSCLMTVRGSSFKCKSCPNVDFCQKCYQSVSLMHPDGHQVEESGPEFEEVEDAVEEKSGDGDGEKKDDGDDSSSTDTSDDDEQHVGEGKEGEMVKRGEFVERKEDVKMPESETDSDTDSDTDDD